MKNEDILRKAIQKAIDGGWYGIYKDGHTWPEAKYILGLQWQDDSETFTDGGIEDAYLLNVEAIIFNHDFAKALWGTSEVRFVKNIGQGHYKVWEYHLQEMVISEDPIKYLGRQI